LIELITAAESLAEAADSLREMDFEEEQDLWLQDAFLYALGCLQGSQAISDQLAWVRELTRLAGGTLSLPPDALGGLEPAPSRVHLERFGLRCQRQASERWLFGRTGLDSAGGFIEQLAMATRLDLESRRPGRPVVGDGFLRRLTTRHSYRTPTQKAALRSTVLMPGGGSLLATMPTGAGKSLVFQLATLWWREGTSPGKACSVVVVPTVSLALDHERTTRLMPGLEGCRSLSSSLSRADYEEVLLSFQRGEIPILFLSPEAALGGARDALLAAATPLVDKPGQAKARLMGFFVDEAHIVETWGRTFRPDFQRLPSLLNKLRELNTDLRTVLLSATVTSTAADLLRQGYAGNKHLDLSAGVARYEFDWVFQQFVDPEERRAALLQAIDLVPRPTVVYSTTREDADGLLRELRDVRGYRRLACFTGETSGLERESIIQAWSKGEIDLIVATSAFGMGVDKANVRSVLHACLPEDASRLYQEVGRGGRDGFQCLALCLWCKDDFDVAKSLSTTQWLTRELAVARWQAIVEDAQSRQAIRLETDGRQSIVARHSASHAGLASKTGKRNREWNRSLLNLLQRIGAIEVIDAESLDPGDPCWTLVVKNPAILSSDPEIIMSLLDARDREQREAQAAFTALKKVVESASKHCVLARIFETLEGHEPQYCGHCAWCKEKGVDPPVQVHYAGINQVWEQRPQRRRTFVPGITLIYPERALMEGGLSTLIRRLTRLGIQQFLLPDGVGGLAAEILGKQMGLGLVLEFSMLCRDDWSAAEMPTALVLCDDRPMNSAILNWAQTWARTKPERVLVLVAAPDVKYQDRALSVLSPLAPYDEVQLDRFHEGGNMP